MLILMFSEIWSDNWDMFIFNELYDQMMFIDVSDDSWPFTAALRMGSHLASQSSSARSSTPPSVPGTSSLGGILIGCFSSPKSDHHVIYELIWCNSNMMWNESMWATIIDLGSWNFHPQNPGQQTSPFPVPLFRWKLSWAFCPALAMYSRSLSDWVPQSVPVSCSSGDWMQMNSFWKHPHCDKSSIAIWVDAQGLGWKHLRKSALWGFNWLIAEVKICEDFELLAAWLPLSASWGCPWQAQTAGGVMAWQAPIDVKERQR